jgi:hypothetical protein
MHSRTIFSYESRGNSEYSINSLSAQLLSVQVQFWGGRAPQSVPFLWGSILYFKTNKQTKQTSYLGGRG